MRTSRGDPGVRAPSGERTHERDEAMSNKFRLLVKALPVVAAVLGARWVLFESMDVGEIVSFGEAGAVITGVTLILGFMLAGVLADYKESERLPGVVASALNGFHSAATGGLASKDLETTWAKQRILVVVDAVCAWFTKGTRDEEMWSAHADLAALIVDAEKKGMGTHYVGRLLTLNGELTNTLSRISVIRNTSFIQAGYVLMGFLVTVMMALLAVVDFPSTVMSWIAPAVLSLVYTYLLFLVKDLDNPFGHAENGGEGSGADVDLGALLAVQQALQGR